MNKLNIFRSISKMNLYRDFYNFKLLLLSTFLNTYWGIVLPARPDLDALVANLFLWRKLWNLFRSKESRSIYLARSTCPKLGWGNKRYTTFRIYMQIKPHYSGTNFRWYSTFLLVLCQKLLIRDLKKNDFSKSF